MQVSVEGVVETPFIKHLLDRATRYLKAGVPVHLTGPAGTGKTTLAMYLAQSLGRPTVFLFGNDAMGGYDLVSHLAGVRHKLLVDNYIKTVLHREEEVEEQWLDSRLVAACRHGYTLVYDEFNRSRAAANNVLLAALEERVLELPGRKGEDHFLAVHKDFRAILTSNPREYAGVHRAPDALLDRVVTLALEELDAETEATITAARTGLDPRDAAAMVRLVRAARALLTNGDVSIRRSLLLAKVLVGAGIRPDPSVVQFREAFCDVFNRAGQDAPSRGALERVLDQGAPGA